MRKCGLWLTAFLLLFLVVTNTFCPDAHAGPHRPKYEMRAVWLTTVYGLDWPTSSDEGHQKRELTQLLDRLQVAGINTVFLQVRGRGDLIYPSSVEPGNPLFARQGKFGYDPLAFAINECHKRGMAVHAWLVALPLGGRWYRRSLASTAYVKVWPRKVVEYKREAYMDPANPATADHLRRIVSELLQKYALDGIHLDYIRYPENTRSFPDRQAYLKAGTSLSLRDWRTQNITAIVRTVHDEVKRQCPAVLFSCATLGTYQRHIAGHDQKGAWTALDDVCQNPVAWAKDSLVDFIVPMHYIRGRSFLPIIEDWKSRVDLPIVIGLGAYRMLPGEGRWPVEEVLEQVALVQRDSTLAGVSFFRADQVANLALPLHRGLRDSLFVAPVLPRPIWCRADSTCSPPPPAPDILALEKTDKGLSVTWTSPSNEEPRLLYSVYCRNHGADPDTDTGDNLIAVTTECQVVIPWERFEDEDLVSLSVGAYDIHTGQECISPPVAYYRRP